MYERGFCHLPSSQPGLTEPEDLLSSSFLSGPMRTHGSSMPVTDTGGSSSTTAQAAVWALSSNKLLVFCDIVLKHANYPNAFLGDPSCDEEDRDGSEQLCKETNETIILKNDRVSESPLNSVGESVRESNRSNTSSTDSVLGELEPDEVDKETFESVTCWCRKPFAGRPMIECEKCLVWYHMSCEQVRRNNIPQLFKCSICMARRRQKKKSSDINPGTNVIESRKNMLDFTKKRNSSSFSSAPSASTYSLRMLGSLSPRSDTNLSFSHATSLRKGSYRIKHKPASFYKSEPKETTPLRIGDVQTKVPSTPLETTSHNLRLRYHKSKPSCNFRFREDDKNNGGYQKARTVPVVESLEEVYSHNLTPTVEDETQQRVPPTSGCQSPPLLLCYETPSTHTSPSFSPIENDDEYVTCNITSAASPYDRNVVDLDSKYRRPLLTSSSRSLPPPKLQPQLSMSVASSSQPGLLLSSNLILEHQGNSLSSTSLTLLHRSPTHQQASVVSVGGGDSNVNAFRQ